MSEAEPEADWRELVEKGWELTFSFAKPGHSCDHTDPIGMRLLTGRRG